MYYLHGENKGTDQLRSYREADLRLCFHICKKKTVFSKRGSLFVAAHPLVNRTAHDLGLSIIDFVGGFLFGNHDIAYLRGKHMRPWEFTGDKSPYNLKPDEKYKTIPELGWYATLNFHNSYSLNSLQTLYE